ncbi:MAG: hypothetical protein U1E81_15025 [Xanthobacteraceae bacterium]
MKLVLLPFLLALTATDLVRDDGQYEHVSPEIRRWFHDLRSPDGGSYCCDETDCLRTEAHLKDDHWQARAPDGKWIDIPPTRVIQDRGNPVGEPILCATWGFDGWHVLCFVPGALL